MDHKEACVGKQMPVACLKERPGRAAKVWRRHCNTFIGQRLPACSAFVKFSWWFLIKHQNTCSKSVLWMGGKKAEFPVSVCQPLKVTLFSIKKKKPQPKTNKKKPSKHPKEKANKEKKKKPNTHIVDKLECIFRKWNDFSCQKHTWRAMQIIHLCVQVWWHLSPVPFGFQTNFQPPQISQIGRPCRHANMHHHHHSSLMYHQPGSHCQEGVSYGKSALLKEYNLTYLPVLFCWNLNSKRMALAGSI